VFIERLHIDDGRLEKADIAQKAIQLAIRDVMILGNDYDSQLGPGFILGEWCGPKAYQRSVVSRPRGDQPIF
jgi:hypothetical protein